MIQFTDRGEGCGYPSIRMRTEETMNATREDIVSSIILWLAIVATFVIV